MDALLDKEVAESGKDIGGFARAVFDTSKSSQDEVLNASQYALLALAPAYGLLRLLREYVPEPDERKGTLELTVEVIIQSISLVLGIILIDRAIIYIPTFSGTSYGDRPNKVLPLLPFIIILLTVQTKLGIKIDMLMQRVSGGSSTATEVEIAADPPETRINYLPQDNRCTIPPPESSPIDNALRESEQLPKAQPSNQEPTDFAFNGGSALAFTPF